MNRLARARSTYLRQHADNPVDWWEWGAGAFDEARRRDVPVLLSVGYASCHWCHVMAHESFEDGPTAQIINRDFVAIKVDREERPDVDATYMAATQALTGQGGWPMTCFLDHDGRAFFAGTYFPREPHGGMPAFTALLAAIAQAWRTDRDGIAAAAARITRHLHAGTAGSLAAADGRPLGAADLTAACRDLLAGLDTRNGGFGGAPKFPPAMAVEFLLRHHERTGDAAALNAASLTLEKMARGGIYDQLAGGFARYSVDNAWHTPHFEKMLDDNALLMRVYAHHARLTGSAFSERVARETADFIIGEMSASDGGFITSLDADTGGVEGGSYRWPQSELLPAVRSATGGAHDGDDGVADVLAVFGVDPARPDPEGEILRRVREPADADRFDRLRAALLEDRRHRPRPGRDEIVVLRSNALAITALAEAGAALGHDEWVDAADAAADAALRLCDTEAGWRHSMFRGVPGPAPATLADLACFASALLALYQATGRIPRLDAATGLLAGLGGRFRAGDGVWFDAPPADAGAVGPGAAGPAVTRPRDPTDGAAPSGLSAVADAFVTAAALTGSDRWRAAAEEIAASTATLARDYPRSAGWHLAVAEALVSGPLQIAVAGPEGPHRDELASVARRLAPGGAVIDVGTPDGTARPLLAGRPGIGGQAAAYVCRGFVCDAPVTTPGGLARAIRQGDVIRG